MSIESAFRISGGSGGVHAICTAVCVCRDHGVIIDEIIRLNVRIDPFDAGRHQVRILFGYDDMAASAVKKHISDTHDR